jgi:hypothetical protein
MDAAAAIGAPAETKCARGSRGERGEERASRETSHQAAEGSTRPAKTHPPTRTEHSRPRGGKGSREGRGGGGEEGSVAWRRREAAPEFQRLHRREARQTSGEGGGAVGADAIRTAGERERRGRRVRGKNGPWTGGMGG